MAGNGALNLCKVSNQVARGLAHIHRHGYVHRDVKSDNLTLDANIVKIIDFGQGAPFGDGLHGYYGTCGYQSPAPYLN